MSDHGHHPCTRAVSMNKVLEHLGFLRFGAGSTLVNLLSWGRVRSVARVVYDRLGLHGRVAVPTPPIDWARTTAYTSVVSTGEGVSVNLTWARAARNGQPSRLRAGAGRGRRRHCSSSRIPRPGEHPDRSRPAQGGGPFGPVPRPGARPPPPACAAVQPFPRAPYGRGRRLALGRSPAGGHLRHGRPGNRAGCWAGDLAGETSPPRSRTRSGSRPTRSGVEADSKPNRSAPTATEEERLVEERLRGLGYLE